MWPYKKFILAAIFLKFHILFLKKILSENREIKILIKNTLRPVFRDAAHLIICARVNEICYDSYPPQFVIMFGMTFIT